MLTKNYEIEKKWGFRIFDDPVDPAPDPAPAEDESNIITTADIAPEISIDVVNGFTGRLSKLFDAMGLTKRTPRPVGSTVKVYKWTGTLETSPDEGVDIPLTKLERVLVGTYDLTLGKYRAEVTAEAIQAKGRARAINEKDETLVKKVAKSLKNGFFTTLATGTGTATAGATLQSALANAWASVAVHFEDDDITPVFFVNPVDVATYLGSATINAQSAFGFSYVENFLGLGTAVITTGVTQGTVIATASENLHYDYVPARGGDLADTFGLTSDEYGYIGVLHTVNNVNASIDTLVIAGGMLYAEDLSGVIVGSITGA